MTEKEIINKKTQQMLSENLFDTEKKCIHTCQTLKYWLQAYFVLSTQYNAVVEQNKSLQSEVLTLKNKNNILETELNQIKLLLEGKNTQYNTLKQECEELKQYVKVDLAPHAQMLQKEIDRCKQALDEIGRVINSLHYQSLIFHNGKTHELADRIQETKNQILDIINKADFRTGAA